MPSEPKQQHYIPETYSKHFSNEDSCINIYDMWENCRTFCTSPKSAFKEKYLYSQPVHAAARFDNAIERLFSETIESDWDNAVKIITEKKPLSLDEINHFTEFLLSMRCRVPNALRAVISLLRDSVAKISDAVSPPMPEALVEIYRKTTGDTRGRVEMQALMNAGIIQINIDPHTALLSMPNIIKGMLPVMNRYNSPAFIHNETDVDFISSDNPVCYFKSGAPINKIIPYNVGYRDDFELILPITSRIALYIDSRKPAVEAHRPERSRQTIDRINEVVALFADRYIFSREANIETLASSYFDKGPVPDFERSIVGNGLVQRISYKVGQPSALSNTWEYPFRR